MKQSTTGLTDQHSQKKKNHFVTQLLVLKFLSKIRIYTNNINIHSVKQENLGYINDPTLIKASYPYHGNGLKQLIKMKIKKNSTLKILKKPFKIIIQSIKIYLEKFTLILFINKQVLIVFDLLISLITLVQFFQIALSITFTEDLPFFINIICYGLLVFDIFIKSLTSEMRQSIQTSGKISLFNNIDYELVCGLITLIPQFLHYIVDSPIISYSRLLFYIRFTNVSQVFYRIEYNMSDVKQNFLQLFKLILMLLLIVHVIGCFWYILGNNETQNWLVEYFQNEINEQDDISLYVTSLYWSITTMLTVGYGDVLPINQKEKLYSIFTMLIGCCLFGYIMNSIGGIFDRINNNEKSFRQEMQKLNNFLETKSVDEKLKQKIRKYLEHYHRKQSSNSQNYLSNLQSISADLVLELKQQITNHLYKNCYLLSNFDKATIYSLSKIIQEKNYLPDELIFERNNEKIELYMILKGQVQEVFQRNCLEEIDTINQGFCFGEIDFVAGYRIQCQFVSSTFSNIFSIDREQFLIILKQSNSFDYQKFRYAYDRLINAKDFKCFNRVCPACFQKDHLLYTCPLLHFYPNNIRMIFRKPFQQREQYFGRRKDKSKHSYIAFKDVQTDALVFLEERESQFEIEEDDVLSDSSQEKQYNLSEIFQSDKFLEIDEEVIEQAKKSLRDNLKKKSIFEIQDLKNKVQSNLNEEYLLQHRQRRERQGRNSKIFMYYVQNHPIHFFLQNDFEKGHNFSYYYPQFNQNIIIQKLQKK